MANNNFDSILKAYAQKFPTKSLLVHGDESMSAREVEYLSSVIHNNLIKMGLKPGNRVAVAMSRSMMSVVVVYALQRSGITYIPVDYLGPNERNVRIVSQSRPDLILLDEDSMVFAEQWDDFTSVGISQLLASESALPQLTTEISPISKQSYILFTSGSTGSPKGIAVSFDGLNTHLSEVQKRFNFTADDVLLFRTSVTFDNSLWEMLLPVYFTGSLVIASHEVMADPDALTDIIKRHGVTCLKVIPSMLSLLLNSGLANSERLRLVLCGGERLSKQLWEFAHAQLPGKLVNAYGQTETVINVAYWESHENYPVGSAVPIGSPIAGLEFAILDERGSPVAPGDTGLLHIKGSQIASSYIDETQLKSSTKISTLDNSSDFYNTGDLVRINAQGDYEFVGRRDEQIKINGTRFELSEIKNAIESLIGNSEAEVLKIHHEIEEEREDSTESEVDQNTEQLEIVAFIKSPELSREYLNNLKQGLKRYLPAQCLPASIEAIPEWPLNASGKIDKAELKRIYLERHKTSLVVSDPKLQQLLNLYEKYLPRPPRELGIDFFDLGGNSLSALRLLKAINTDFQIEILLGDFLTQSSIEGINQLIAKTTTSPREIRTAVDKNTLEDYRQVPVSFSQLRFIYLNQMMESRNVYTLSSFIKLPNEIAFQQIQEVVKNLIIKNPIIGTQFFEHEKKFYQKFQLGPEHKVQRLDLTPLSLIEKQEALDKIRAIATDTLKGPLFAAYFVEWSESEKLLALVLDHSISDGWTNVLLSKNVKDMSSALLRGESIEVTRGVNYYDYALQEQDRYHNHVENSLSYWAQELCGELPILSLPTCSERPPSFSHKGTSISKTLTLANSHRISETAKTLNVSENTLLLAAYVIMLSRWTRQRDIIIGVPVSCREIGGAETVAGCFVNTLPIRLNLDEIGSTDSLKFHQVTQYIKAKLFTALQYQWAPFDKIVEFCKIKRSADHSPIYQTLFSYQDYVEYSNAIGGKFEGDGFQKYKVPHHVAQTDLSFYLYKNSNETFECQIEFYNDAYTQAKIERFWQGFLTVLDSAASTPFEVAEKLQAIPSSDAREIINLGRGLSKPLQAPTAYHWIAEQAQKDLNKIATLSESEQYSYGSLLETTAAYAQVFKTKLQGHAASEKPPRIGVGVSRSALLPAQLLAVMAVGCAYVPMDPDFPKERLRYIAQDSGIALILVDDDTEQQFGDFNLPLINVNRLRLENRSASEGTVVEEFIPGKEAYVIYTSGSTGKPKGVSISHQAMVNFLEGMSTKPGFSKEDSLLAVTTLSFDISVLELFLPLMMGGKVYVASSEESRDGELLAGLIESKSITVMQATPATWRMLMQLKWKPNQPLKALCGGEALPVDLADYLLQTKCDLWNMYGPTETTVWSTVANIDGNSNTTSIGKPILNTQIIVADNYGQPMPLGVPGELLIGGLGLANGYVNLPEQTGSKFRPASGLLAKTIEPDAQFYHTGDLAILDVEGELRCLGRIDHQLKVRGYRIEPGEIEATILESGVVNNIAVVKYSFNQGDDRLVAFYEADEQHHRSFFKQRFENILPDYMIPQHFYQLDKLPLTPNGKVDKKALCNRPLDLDQVHETGSPLVTGNEFYIANIWKELIGCHDIMRDDYFFDIGGHSLLAFRFIKRIKSERGIQLTVRDLLFSNIQGLAERLERESQNATQQPTTNSANSKKISILKRFLNLFV